MPPLEELEVGDAMPVLEQLGAEAGAGEGRGHMAQGAGEGGAPAQAPQHGVGGEPRAQDVGAAGGGTVQGALEEGGSVPPAPRIVKLHVVETGGGARKQQEVHEYSWSLG